MRKSPEKQQAKDAGLIRYFTGVPCKRGHVCDRHVKDGACVECTSINREKWRAENRERTRELTRQWRQENPDKWRCSQKVSSRKNYWKHRLKRLEGNKAARKANPEKFREQSRKSRIKADPVKRRETKRRWREKNRDRSREITKRASKRFIEKNPLAPRIWRHNRRARSVENGGKHTASDIQKILKMQNGKCAYCRTKVVSRYHVDHIIPLSKSGSNGAANLQVLCRPCNQEKAARDPIEFSRTRGMLI